MIAPAPSRSPWQRLYGAVHRARVRWYARRARRLPRPTVSIGNLHLGGGGKTPFVAAVAARLTDAGARVAILSRGYRSAGSGVRVVGIGAGPLLGAAEAGDEPVLLAESLPGVVVLVSPDRVAAAERALTLPAVPDVFLLDDGFSHLAVRRDLDVLLFPAADPFGGGRLLPSGRLREPLAAAARADAVVLTGAAAGDREAGPALARALAAQGYRGPGFASATRALGVVDGEGRPLAPGTRVVAAAGIARPQGFFDLAREQGLAVVATLAFPDHASFGAAAVARLDDALAEHQARALLVTAKDAVKLRLHTHLPLAVLPIVAEPEAAFWTWFDGQRGRWR